jgi:hypothetical protein
MKKTAKSTAKTKRRLKKIAREIREIRQSASLGNNRIRELIDCGRRY